jgi:hypothetical protein
MPTDPQHELLKAYEAIFKSADGEKILNDLVIFAQQTADPVVRCGQMDVILRLFRCSQRGKELTPVRTIKGRASTLGQAAEEE